MATSFGWTEPALQAAVIELIGSGQMKARVDSQGGVLVAKRKDVRAEAFKHALEEGERIQRRTMAAQLRWVGGWIIGRAALNSFSLSPLSLQAQTHSRGHPRQAA
jgi:hypothetical protein